jgi:PAS domain S-box-containing protein
MSDGIIATDRRGRVRIVNDMAIKMLGMSKEDLNSIHLACNNRLSLP